MPETKTTWKYMNAPDPLYRLPKYLWKEHYGNTKFDSSFPGNLSSMFPPGKWPNLLFLSDVRHLHQVDFVQDLVLGTESGLGQGVTIYIVDSGALPFSSPFEYPHSGFFDQRVFPGFPGFSIEVRNSSGGPTWGDPIGHGTMCTSAALSMAPQAKIVVYKVNAAIGDDFLTCLNAAVMDAAENTPSVVSISATFDLESLDDADELLAMVNPIVNIANASGVIVFAAAGNVGTSVDLVTGEVTVNDEGELPSLPAGMPGVISVGGAYPLDLTAPTNPQSWEPSTFALSGSFVTPLGAKLEYPDLSGIVGHMPKGALVCCPAPPFSANGLIGTLYDQLKGDSGWYVTSGTSFATPCIAGIVALLLEKYPEFPTSPGWGAFDVEKIREFLQAACVEVPVPDGGNYNVSPTGAGVLNAKWLLENAQG